MFRPFLIAAAVLAAIAADQDAASAQYGGYYGNGNGNGHRPIVVLIIIREHRFEPPRFAFPQVYGSSSAYSNGYGPQLQLQYSNGNGNGYHQPFVSPAFNGNGFNGNGYGPKICGPFGCK